MTPQDIHTLERFYSSINIPKEFQFNKAIKYLDLPRFVQTNLQLLKEGKITGQTAKIRYDDLVEIKAVLEISSL